jgi:hypothetical protein
MKAAAPLLLSAAIAFAGMPDTFELFRLDFDKMDGAKGMVLYGAILEHLQAHPQESLAWLAEEEDILDAMAGDWSSRYFTDYTGGQQAALAAQKRAACASLRKSKVKGQAERAAMARLAGHLDTLSIRVIDSTPGATHAESAETDPP